VALLAPLLLLSAGSSHQLSPSLSPPPPLLLRPPAGVLPHPRSPDRAARRGDTPLVASAVQRVRKAPTTFASGVAVDSAGGKQGTSISELEVAGAAVRASRAPRAARALACTTGAAEEEDPHERPPTCQPSPLHVLWRCTTPRAGAGFIGANNKDLRHCVPSCKSPFLLTLPPPRRRRLYQNIRPAQSTGIAQSGDFKCKRIYIKDLYINLLDCLPDA
jgi:hypothetical protein